MFKVGDKVIYKRIDEEVLREEIGDSQVNVLDHLINKVGVITKIQKDDKSYYVKFNDKMGEEVCFNCELDYVIKKKDMRPEWF